MERIRTTKSNTISDPMTNCTNRKSTLDQLQKISKADIKKAIYDLKRNKATVPDDIPAETTKTDMENTTDILYDLMGS